MSHSDLLCSLLFKINENLLAIAVLTVY